MNRLCLIGLLSVLLLGCDSQTETSDAADESPEDRIFESFRGDIARYARAEKLAVRVLITEYSILPGTNGFVANVKWRARQSDPKMPRVQFYRWYRTELRYDEQGRFVGVVTNAMLPES